MDWNISTVVVGIDGSEGSTRAAEYAVSLARNTGAAVKLVTVVRPPEGWWGIGGAPPSPEALSTALIEGQQQVLREMEEHLLWDGVEYETMAELGDPATRLMEICRDTNADLLVIGRRGAGLAERVILGSTADRLTHHSECPVLVVP